MPIEMSKLTLWAVLAASALAACQKGGVTAVPLAASVQRPSNVAFLVDVSSRGEPAPNLTASHFEVSEDGETLDPAAIKLTLLDPTLAAATGTMLLVDVTGRDEARGESLARAVGDFVREVRRVEPVWVYVFDGNDEIFEIASFGRSESTSATEGQAEKDGGEEEPKAATEKKEDAAEPLPKLDALTKAATTAVSRNVNGAVAKALSVLDEKLAANDKPIRVGSLVVLMSGPDTAGRVTEAQMNATLDRSRHAVYAVGADGAPLHDVGRTAGFRPESGEPLEALLPKVASRVIAARESKYLLSYCSPSRTGHRTVSVHVSPEGAGRGGAGSFESQFFADGFSEDCDPNDPPRFVVTLVFGPNGPAAVAPPPSAPAEVEAEPPSKATKPKPAAGSKPSGRPAPAAPAPASKPASAPAPPASDGFEP
jgi:hypothetical protein